MKSLRYCLFLLTLSIASHLHAQRISRVTYGLDAGTAFTNQAWAPSITYYQNLTFDRLPWLGIGWTGHFSAMFAHDKPVLETSGNAVAEDKIFRGGINMFGGAFGLTVNLNFDKVEIGANADLLNLSFGKTTKALYKITDLASANDSSLKYHNTHITTYPTAFNAVPLLVKKSNGQSHVYLRFWINPEFGIKLGYMLINASYTSEYRFTDRKRIFSTNYGMPFAAISFKIPN